ncbi:MAG: hypothetical protein AMXMBFR36_35440 [Acidobacteriota bacterium]
MVHRELDRRDVARGGGARETDDAVGDLVGARSGRPPIDHDDGRRFDADFGQSVKQTREIDIVRARPPDDDDPDRRDGDGGSRRVRHERGNAAQSSIGPSRNRD